MLEFINNDHFIEKLAKSHYLQVLFSSYRLAPADLPIARASLEVMDSLCEHYHTVEDASLYRIIMVKFLLGFELYYDYLPEEIKSDAQFQRVFSERLDKFRTLFFSEEDFTSLRNTVDVSFLKSSIDPEREVKVFRVAKSLIKYLGIVVEKGWSELGFKTFNQKLLKLEEVQSVSNRVLLSSTFQNHAFFHPFKRFWTAFLQVWDYNQKVTEKFFRFVNLTQLHLLARLNRGILEKLFDQSKHLGEALWGSFKSIILYPLQTARAVILHPTDFFHALVDQAKQQPKYFLMKTSMLVGALFLVHSKMPRNLPGRLFLVGRMLEVGIDYLILETYALSLIQNRPQFSMAHESRDEGLSIEEEFDQYFVEDEDPQGQEDFGGEGSGSNPISEIVNEHLKQRRQQIRSDAITRIKDRLRFEEIQETRDATIEEKIKENLLNDHPSFNQQEQAYLLNKISFFRDAIPALLLGKQAQEEVFLEALDSAVYN